MEIPGGKHCKAKLVIIESFYGGSHKQLVDLLFDQFGAVKFVLPAKKWHWRARTSALYFSQTIPQCEAYQVVFTSSVLNLAELVALRPDLGRLKKVLYFHENQLVYPVRKHQERDFQYGYNQILSCLVADIVLFNSTYNLDSFLNNIQSFMKLIPDHRPKGLSDLIRPKCQVLYYPLSFTSLDRRRTKDSESNELHICDNMIECKKYGVAKKNDSVGDKETSDTPISVLRKEVRNEVPVCQPGSFGGLSEEYQEENITAKRARHESDDEPEKLELSSRTLDTMERGNDSVSESFTQSYSAECVVMETCDRTRNLVEGGDLVPMQTHSGESIVMETQKRTMDLVEGKDLHCKVSMESHPEKGFVMETSNRNVGIMARGDLNCDGAMQKHPEGTAVKKTEILGDSEVGRPLHIVWAHRWEHDKDPDTFFQTLFRLHDDGVPFSLSVMGETYSEEPEIFEVAQDRLKEHIITWGFQQNKGDYSRILWSADVAVSTAIHEFFGVSMLEAVYCGCYALCPERLVYPEIFPASCLYRTPTQLYKRLRAFCRHPHLARNHKPQVDLDLFSWETLQEKYERILCVDETKK